MTIDEFLRLSFVLVFTMISSVPALAWKPESGSDLIGTNLPEFASSLKWLNCDPITMSSLKGRVVFVRFWMVNCHACHETMPSDSPNRSGRLVVAIVFD